MEIAEPIGSLSLLILYLSGWFPDWEEDFRTSHSNLTFVLLTMSALSWCRPWEVNGQFFVHPAWIGFLIIFFGLGHKLSADSIFPLFGRSFCTGTLFLFLHELMKANADWTYRPFQFVLFCGVIFLSYLISGRLSERIWYTGMCLMILHVWILFFYRERLNPFVLGSEAFMDTLWLVLIGILFMHFLEKWIWIRVMKKSSGTGHN
ncbi:hypothetical protein [Thermoactinomyces mirandus]|uniref:Uncharacterized protein n=1 Tax=Thermoactinomyces mirandus TaxID=2756294 RepID=A0A7W1XV02_9BACL|nr:hypothetical protein [Thermoactinomyces mirandus]MBA4603703.1 hypothetical protein [Thermoactinomyces mirandus]